MSTSIHADLLNDLNKMAFSVNYAVRKPTLLAAETLIAKQEQQIDALLAAAKAARVKLEDALPYVKEHIPRCEINAAIEELTAAIAAAEGRGW